MTLEELGYVVDENGLVITNHPGGNNLHKAMIFPGRNRNYNGLLPDSYKVQATIRRRTNIEKCFRHCAANQHGRRRKDCYSHYRDVDHMRPVGSGYCPW